MDEASLQTLLKSIGIAVAHMLFPTPPSLPYIIWQSTGISKLEADNIVYAKENNYRIELYTKKKDPATESLLENLFDTNDIAYEKSDDIYIDSEKMFEVYYEI